MFALCSKLLVIRKFLLSRCIQNRRLWGINWREVSSAVTTDASSIAPSPSASLFITTKDECVART